MAWIVRWHAVEERYGSAWEAQDRWEALDALGRAPELVEAAAAAVVTRASRGAQARPGPGCRATAPRRTLGACSGPDRARRSPGARARRVRAWRSTPRGRRLARGGGSGRNSGAAAKDVVPLELRAPELR